MEKEPKYLPVTTVAAGLWQQQLLFKTLCFQRESSCR